jgi:hypothetical protein
VIVSRGNEVIETITLGGHMIIGRAAGAVFSLKIPPVAHSRHVSEGRGPLFLVDLNSLNGTLLNGRKIAPMQPTAGNSGDIAELGEYILRFQIESQPVAPDQTRPRFVTPDIEPPPSASPLLENLVERHHEIPLWTQGDIQLKIADIIDETDDVKTFRLVGLSPVLFSFKPGQFVTIKVNINGTDVRVLTRSHRALRVHTAWK